MLEVRNLHARVTGTKDEILRGLNLKIESGKICAIMGPNGSGKSTLANVITGNPEYELTKGEILIKNEDVTECTPDERSHKGLYMAFQYPAEIPGVKPWQFLKAALDSKADANKTAKLSVREFSKKFDEAVEKAGLPKELAQRALNDGFSGGEKKRAEIMQLLVLEPQIVVLDETDSGLDVDALRMVGQTISGLRSKERSFLVVTHYHRILDYIKPDEVHVLIDGKIAKSGGPDLAMKIEKEGYENL